MSQSGKIDPLSDEDLKIAESNTKRALEVYRNGGSKALRNYLKGLFPTDQTDSNPEPHSSPGTKPESDP